MSIERHRLDDFNSVASKRTPAAEPWLESAADLLREDDPGPTPFLVEGLIVESAIVAMQGPPKVSKTWALLELAMAIVSGRDAFNRYAVKQGPVVVVLEESGRAALHRRLDMLRRGYGQQVDEFAELHVAANRRVRLDDPKWQNSILDACGFIQPIAVFFDPLARLKAPARDENLQKDIAPLLDFMRLLRDATASRPAVAFAHHTGHAGSHLRGSSDLEAYWESKLTLTRTDKTVTMKSEHREAEAGDAFNYRLDWDETTRSLRLQAIAHGALEQVKAYLADDPDASANTVFAHIGGNRKDVLAAVKTVKGGGTNLPVPPEYHPSEHSLPGGTSGAPIGGRVPPLEVPVPRVRYHLADEGYDERLLELVEEGWLTQDDALEKLDAHRLVGAA